MIELKHFRLLRAIARHGTMSGAARELGYTQPAVTQQIQSLERTLRTPLVTRNRTGFRLTDAGELLLRHGASVLATVSLAQAEVEAIAGLRAGRVRIACFPSAAAMLLPRALGAMTAEHPGVSFTLAETEPPKALEMLRRGECDIAIVYLYVTAGSDGPSSLVLEAGEIRTQLLEESVHVAMPKGHPAAAKRWVDLRELRDARWIAGCAGCRGNLLEACAASGFTPDIAFETDDYVALQGLAAAGLGVALVPDLMRAAARHEPGLALRRLHPMSVRVVSAVSTTALMGVPGVAQTVAALRESAAEVDLADIPS
ncbi:LysR family transcriptional regulator [Nonomuraea purpurea]|uniref:LysR family transcriptional regulator n=1 Tax=Nonomuraea purpurea TaxID=1849276 RepID=A0ABV8GJJ3_9ACTN